MATVSITDLTNAKLDTDHIADIATSLALTAVDRLGTTKKTLQGAINSIAAIDVKGAWATATAYVVKDAVLESGTWYICIEAHTSGTFATDLAAGKWSVLQGITDANLKDYAVRKLDFVSDMKAMTNPQAGEIIILKDYASGNGAGVMFFETKATTGMDDGGSVINHDTLAFRFEQIFDGIVTVKQFGAVGDGVTDDTTSVLNAAAYKRYIWLPIGSYLMSSRLRESTNGGSMVIIGESRRRSKLLFPSVADGCVWLGNSNGHGNYRHLLYNFTIDCVNQTAGSTALILHEAGTGVVRDVDLTQAETLCKAVGCIGSVFEGKCEWTTATNGLITSTPITGTPSSIDDLTTTASPLSLNPNITVIKDMWFSNISQTSVQLTGGLMHLRGCTFQNCGNSLSHDVISLLGANEVKDYGGGPIVEKNWVEGGSYRFAIAVRNTKGARVKNNFIVGSSTNSPSNFPKEGAILKHSDSSECVIKGNSIGQYFVATPTEGRTSNGGVYTVGSLQKEDVFDNYHVKTQVKCYYEGRSEPTTDRIDNIHRVVITGSSGAIEYDSHGVISSSVRNGAGDYTITLNYNRETIAGGYPVRTHARTSSAVKSYSASAFGNGNPSNERIAVHDEAGTQADPRQLSIEFLSGWQGI